MTADADGSPRDRAVASATAAGAHRAAASPDRAAPIERAASPDRFVVSDGAARPDRAASPDHGAARGRAFAWRWGARGLLWGWHALREAVRDRIHRDGAQLAFFALLSFVPLSMLLVAVLGLFVDDGDARRRLVTTVFDAVPLSSAEDRRDIEASVLDALRRVGSLSVLTVVLLLVSASGVMGALRHTINVAYDIEARPSILRRKALDGLLVVVGTSVLGAGMALRSTGDVGAVLSFALVTLVLAGAYRFLPTHRPRWRDVVLGALLAAVGLVLVREALELYFEDLSDLGALYGSFGALMALLLFTYASALVVLFGAELASELPRLPPDPEPQERVRAALGRLRRRRAGSRV